MEIYYYQNINRSTLEQQRGFALIALLLLMPLVLLALVFLYLSTTQIEIRSSLHQTCRVQLLKTQESAAIEIRNLMALNKVVQLVKRISTIAEFSRLLIIAFPFLAPLINGIVAATRSAAQTVRIIQKTILFKIQATMTLGLFETQAQLRTIINKYRPRVRQLATLEEPFVGMNPVVSLAVEAVSPRSKLTTYRLKNDFENKQSLKVQWRYHLKASQTFNAWTRWHQHFNGSCAATLRKEEPWNATLYEDKSLLRFL